MSPVATSPLSRVWGTVRLADDNDVPNIHRMIRQSAEAQGLSQTFSATESTISSTFFPKGGRRSPFPSFTVLIHEVSIQEPAQRAPVLLKEVPKDSPNFMTPVTRCFDLAFPISDPQAEAFASPRGTGAVAAGFVAFFPSFSTFLVKPGFHVEDLFVRGEYRGQGFGKMLLSVVAAQAARMGLGRVEWSVLDQNTKAIKFYEGMGAEVLPDWRICSLSGDALMQYYPAEEDADQCNSD